MCNVCNGKEQLPDAPHYLRMEIQGTFLSIGYDAYSTDSSFSEDIKINFCPNCGKKL